MTTLTDEQIDEVISGADATWARNMTTTEEYKRRTNLLNLLRAQAKRANELERRLKAYEEAKVPESIIHIADLGTGGERVVRIADYDALLLALRQSMVDAERYRFIRSNNSPLLVSTHCNGEDLTMNGEELDEAIDAARGQHD